MRHIRVSPRKAKLVVDLVRGKDVSEALAILAFTPNAAAPVLHKLISSAKANAVNNLEMDADSSTLQKSTPTPAPRSNASVPAPGKCFHHFEAHKPL